MQHHAEAIRKHWREATDETRQEGARWYAEARALVFRMSMEYGTSEETMAGVIAALSQQCSWDLNIEHARRLMEGEDYPGGLPLACEKAVRIRDGGDPEEVLGPRAFKVREFYRALAGSDNAAVVDTWMLLAMRWDRPWYGAAQYRALADVLRKEAERLGLPVVEFQAIVWCQARKSADLDKHTPAGRKLRRQMREAS